MTPKYAINPRFKPCSGPCNGKLRYDRKIAKRVAMEYRTGKRVGRESTSGAWCMDAYRCKECGNWHIGHNPRKYMKSKKKVNNETNHKQ